MLLIGLVIALSPRVYAYFFSGNELTISFEELRERNKQLVQNDLKTESKKEPRKRRFKVPNHSFDPNELSKSDWVKMGLSSKQADVVLRFTERGIYANEELKKIFVIPDELYSLIKDSTYYPSREKAHDHHEFKNEPVKEEIMVDLSTCSKDELMRVPGIGDFFGRKIIEYREKLGGYKNVDQLLEVWKMDRDRLEKIRPYLEINDYQIRKININESDVDQLKLHPYISFAVANSIVKIREQKGKYSSVEGIKTSKLIDEELYNKLEPYLTVE